MKTERQIKLYGDQIYNTALELVDSSRIVMQSKEILKTIMVILEDDTLYDLKKLDV